MKPIATNLAGQINQHHAQAVQKADEAVGHAIQAGRLLLQAKEGLRHGQFLQWVEEHLTVSPRQAQRYIAAAQGRPVPIRTSPPKATPMSHLERPNTPAQEQAKFAPTPSAWQWCAGPDGRGSGLMTYVVEPSSEHPGYFFVSHLYEGGDAYDCTRRPVAQQFVADNLRLFGLHAPEAAIWHSAPSQGVRVALETINSEETTQAALQEARARKAADATGDGAIQSPQLRGHSAGVGTRV